MNPLTILKKDHRHVLSLLDKALKTTDRAKLKRKKLFSEITTELKSHTKMEEKLLYPPLLHIAKTHGLILEAFEEHSLVNYILLDMQRISLTDETWKAKLMVLSENVHHHINEEEKTLFPLVRNLLTADELKLMGSEMQNFKEGRSKNFIKGMFSYALSSSARSR